MTSILNSKAYNALNITKDISAKLGSINEQLSSGRRVNSALDDPTDYYTSLSLDDKASKFDGFVKDIKQSQTLISGASKSVDSVIDGLKTARSQLRQAISSEKSAARATLAADHDDQLEFVTKLARDNDYNGTNILAGDNYTTFFNELRTSFQTIKGANISTLESLGLNQAGRSAQESLTLYNGLSGGTVSDTELLLTNVFSDKELTGYEAQATTSQVYNSDGSAVTSDTTLLTDLYNTDSPTAYATAATVALFASDGTTPIADGTTKLTEVYDSDGNALFADGETIQFTDKDGNVTDIVTVDDTTVDAETTVDDLISALTSSGVLSSASFDTVTGEISLGATGIGAGSLASLDGFSDASAFSSSVSFAADPGDLPTAEFAIGDVIQATDAEGNSVDVYTVTATSTIADLNNAISANEGTSSSFADGVFTFTGIKTSEGDPSFSGASLLSSLGTFEDTNPDSGAGTALFAVGDTFSVTNLNGDTVDIFTVEADSTLKDFLSAIQAGEEIDYDLDTSTGELKLFGEVFGDAQHQLSGDSAFSATYSLEATEDNAIAFSDAAAERRITAIDAKIKELETYQATLGSNNRNLNTRLGFSNSQAGNNRLGSTLLVEADKERLAVEVSFLSVAQQFSISGISTVASQEQLALNLLGR